MKALAIFLTCVAVVFGAMALWMFTIITAENKAIAICEERGQTAVDAPWDFGRDGWGGSYICVEIASVP